MGKLDRYHLGPLVERVLEFRRARRWEIYHSPGNLAKGLAIEASELLEHFLWTRSPAEERRIGKSRRGLIADELADIAVFLIYLAHDLKIDLADAVDKKLAKNAAKYPVSKARGSAKKYTEL